MSDPAPYPEIADRIHLSVNQALQAEDCASDLSHSTERVNWKYCWLRISQRVI